MAFAALLLTPFGERWFACILSNSAYLTVFPRGPHQEHQHHLMNNRSVPNLEERLKHASEAKKLMLAKFKTSLVEGPPCLIGMEACVGAHHLSRKLKAFGHDARLMPSRSKI